MKSKRVFQISLVVAAIVLGACTPALAQEENTQSSKTSNERPEVDYTVYAWREWTDLEGDVLFGQFEKIHERTQVVIVGADGVRVEVPVYKLSDSDIYEALQCSMESGEEQPIESIDINEFETTDLESIEIDSEFDNDFPSDEASSDEAPKEQARSEREREFALMRQWDQMRTWTDSTGEHSFDGTFLRIEERSKVFLQNTDGKEFSIRISKLSPDDMFVAVHGELSREGGSQRRRYNASAHWIPGKNRN